jgi:ATP-dependent DNA helicase RecQ
MLESPILLVPLTEQDFLRISGVGKFKMETFGKLFLEVIQEVAKSKGLASRMNEKPVVIKKEPKIGDRGMYIKSLLDKGLSVEQVAATIGIKEGTVYTYLEQLVSSKKITDISPYVAHEAIQPIEALVREKPTSFLRELKLSLESQGHVYDYDTIRLVRALTLSNLPAAAPNGA